MVLIWVFVLLCRAIIRLWVFLFAVMAIVMIALTVLVLWIGAIMAAFIYGFIKGVGRQWHVAKT